ncbi:MAG: helix-turn-helix transcriptional regulator [Eubacteriaceae bacterium]
MAGEQKNYRILDLYLRFDRGSVLNKKSLADLYEVNERSIQRDITDLNEYLSKEGNEQEVVYDRSKKGYIMKRRGSLAFSDSDIFAISKILLESRGFSKTEMYRMLDTLLLNCEEKKIMKEAIENERFYYEPPKHNQNIVDFLWKMNESIIHFNEVEVLYEKQDGTLRTYTIKPKGLIFNEYYFYLIAEKKDDPEQVSRVYRVDRFKEYKVTETTFVYPDTKRFKGGEFRKRIQFMYVGELTTVTFKFWGDSLEAVLDRLPTARVIGEEEGVAIVKAEVYAEGLLRWFLSQKEGLEILEPKWYRNEMKMTLKKMLENYEKEESVI